MMKSINVGYLKELKKKQEPLTALTAYDATQAKLFESSGVEMILVGDSLGMLVKGEKDTLSVTTREMLYHTKCVSRGLAKSFLVADMPFLSYSTPREALRNAGLLIKKGKAKMVKVEGANEGNLKAIEELVSNHIPVCGHLGLNPQSILEIGKYGVFGKTIGEVEKLKQGVKRLEELGVLALVLECVPKPIAREITETTTMTVIGIGSGNACDGQIAVHYDILGMSDKKMKFIRNFLKNSSGVSEAIAVYCEAVKKRSFPNDEEAFLL